jgi:hypothetical protein
VHARSALFDLYGDHLGPRGGQAPVAALVRLLEPLGIAAPAVRTAVSRMVRQGWLDPVALPAGPGYRLTARGRTRLEQAASRIYRIGTPSWDGCWHLLVVEHVPDRQARDRVRSGLAFLGYGQLADATWVAPWASPEVEPLLAADKVRAEAFTARHQPVASNGDALHDDAMDGDGLDGDGLVGRGTWTRWRRPTSTGWGPRAPSWATRTRRTTGPRSPPAASSSTSGASSCSATPGSPASCCPPTGRATVRPSSSRPPLSGCARLPTGSSTPA